MMKTISCGIAVAFCAVAYAVDVTTDTTVTISANSDTPYNIASGVTLKLTVPAGMTNTLSGAITGGGAIRKEGEGGLRLSSTGNTFSGGMYTAVGTVFAAASGAFGTGGITNEWRACTVFDSQGGVFPNDIYMLHDTGPSYSYPETAPIQFAKDATMNGDISAGSGVTAYLANHRASTSTSTARGPRVVFTGRITPGKNKILSVNSYGTNAFHGAILDSNGADGIDYCANFGVNYSSSGTVELASPLNVFRNGIKFYSEVISCLADNVISNAIVYWRYATSGTNPYGDTLSTLRLNGTSQRIRSLCTHSGVNPSPLMDNNSMVVSTGRSVLTILGEETSRTAKCRIQDDITIILDAALHPSFTQTFTGRACPTIGDIIISNGTFRITEDSSFANVPNIVIGPNGTLDNQATGIPFASVTNMVVDGTFVATNASSVGFSDGRMSLAIGSNASIALPDNAILIVNSLKVDGADVTGKVSAGEHGLVSGTIFVNGEPTSATWTGAGESQSIVLADNWQAHETPSFGGGLNVTFAADDAVGFTADVDRDVQFGAVNLSSASGFTFAGTGTMLVANGISAAEPEPGNRVVYDFLSPLWLISMQTLDFPTNATLKLAGGSVFSRDVVRTGQGDFVISGSNVWDRKVIVRDCDVFITGTITTSTGIDEGKLVDDKNKVDTENGIYMHMETADSVSPKSTKDSICTISNAVIERPFQIRTKAVSSRDKFRCSPGTTNYFKSYFLSADQSNNGLRIPSSSEVYFDGGGSFIWSFYLNGGGTAYFRNKPIKTLNSGVGLSLTGGTKAVFEVGGNTIKALSNDGGMYDFRADDVIGAAGYMWLRDNNSVLQLNSTSQMMGYFSNHVARTGSYINGAGATIFITNNVANRESSFRIPFTGDVSLKVNTPSQVWLDSAASTSTGDITVERGTLQFRSEASWTNVSEVAVSGTGRLEIQAASGVTARPVFGKKATMRLSDEGVIALPDGACVWVKYLYVNGVLQPRGAYRYDTIQDATVKAHFDPASTGTLIVRGDGGFSLTIR